MNGFISAVRFLTSFPVWKTKDFDASGMVKFFPVVGLGIGFFLAVLDRLLMALWPVWVASLLEVFFLVIVSGALHLDGLGDAADGLFSHRSREKILEIMKDSRIGAMGMIAVFFCLTIKWAGISALEPGFYRSMILLLVPSLSRATMVFGIHFFDYGRPEGGLGQDVVVRENWKRRFLPMVIPAAGCLLVGLWGVVLLIVFIIGVSGIVRYYRSRLNCITGDMIGAMEETMEAVLFLAASLGGGI